MLCASHTTGPFLTEDKIHSCLTLGLLGICSESVLSFKVCRGLRHMLIILLPPAPISSQADEPLCLLEGDSWPASLEALPHLCSRAQAPVLCDGRRA